MKHFERLGMEAPTQSWDEITKAYQSILENFNQKLINAQDGNFYKRIQDHINNIHLSYEFLRNNLTNYYSYCTTDNFHVEDEGDLYSGDEVDFESTDQVYQVEMDAFAILNKCNVCNVFSSVGDNAPNTFKHERTIYDIDYLCTLGVADCVAVVLCDEAENLFAIGHVTPTQNVHLVIVNMANAIKSLGEKYNSLKLFVYGGVGPQDSAMFAIPFSLHSVRLPYNARLSQSRLTNRPSSSRDTEDSINIFQTGDNLFLIKREMPVNGKVTAHHYSQEFDMRKGLEHLDTYQESVFIPTPNSPRS